MISLNKNISYQKYQCISKKIAEQYHYPTNIEHLLSLILPAFILKYGTSYEELIIDCFWNVPILIEEQENTIATAVYSSYLEQDTVKRFIVLNHYTSSSFLEHFDNLIHEYNHAINSYKNILKKDGNNTIVRSGLSYVLYQDHKKIFHKHIALEEVLNTKQTEETIQILLSLENNPTGSYEIESAIYSLKQELNGERYHSFAYAFLVKITIKLFENKTFFKTIEQLRLDGNIDLIPTWFDGITNQAHSYEILNDLLDSLLKDLKKTTSQKKTFFLKRKITKKIEQITNIIDLFDQGCLYK